MKRLIMMLLLVALAIPATAFAAISGSEGTTIADGKATLVSDNVTPYSYISFDDLNGQPVASLTELSADVYSATSWGGGSPRFQVKVSDGTTTKNIMVNLGDLPNFTSGNTGDTGNLLDAGLRVDSSQLNASGGTFYDTWTGAKAAADAGGFTTISNISLMVDGGWSVAQTFVFDSVSINGTVNPFGVVAPVPTCTTVATSQGSMTAAVVNPGTGYALPLPLSGCQIGVYFDQAGSVKNADIAGATHYGVFADKGAKVDVTGSQIHRIGSSPFNGAQHGRAVFYANGATGTVSGNTISDYQKNGVHVTGAGTSVKVQKNTVTGRGQIGTIAQNGIVVVSGAFAQVWDNTVSQNYYTGAETYATGILVIDATVNMTKKNVVTLNGVNIDIAGTIVGKKSSA